MSAGTLAHYRNWSAQVQARYQMFNPEAIRPARRIYVGGLPGGTSEVSSLLHTRAAFNSKKFGKRAVNQRDYVLALSLTLCKG